MLRKDATMIRRILQSLAGNREETALADHPPVKDGAGKRLLIVDDEPNIVRFMVIILQPHGYEIDTASNGQEALEKLRISRPNLLITDSMMPVMDGFALTTAIRSDALLRSLPVMMMQAIVFEADLAVGVHTAAMNCGVDYVLKKPFNGHEFVAFVADILKQPQGEP